MPKVSVIVPSYNTKPSFFKQCIESLLHQTLGDFEIIIIDDGSPKQGDSDAPCIQLAKSYAEASVEKLPRIKFLQQDHKGVSEARNLGIQTASGEYIVFLDSDDWFETDTLESLYHFATQSQSDITLFENFRDSENFSQSYKAFEKDIPVFDKDNYVDLVKNAVQTNPQHCGIIIGVCCKFYKKEFLQKNGLLFHKSISLGEDRLFFLNTLCKQPKVSYLARPFYHYRISEGSLSQGIRNDFGTLVEQSEKNIGSLPLYQIYGIDKKVFLSWLYTDLARIIFVSLIQNYINPENTESFSQTKKNFLQFIETPACQRALQNFNRDAFTKKELFKLDLARHKTFAILYLFKIKLSLQRKLLCRHK